MTRPGTCAFCDRIVDADLDYERITAWRKRRHGTNSPNYVRLIEIVADEWACRFCVDREAKGVPARQGSMF